MTTSKFLALYPVFSLDQARATLSGDVRQRIGRAVLQGRVIRLRREIFATVPADRESKSFLPSPYLVMPLERPDAILAGHSALELLGVAHSVWNTCVAYSRGRRGGFSILRTRYEVVGHPTPLGSWSDAHGVLLHERQGIPLQALGPERCLVDGFYRPRLFGGVVELVRSLDAVYALDMELIREILSRYDKKNLYAAIGWFLERHSDRFSIPAELFRELAARGPKSPVYLEKSVSRSQLVRPWNIYVPTELMPGEEFLE